MSDNFGSQTMLLAHAGHALEPPPPRWPTTTTSTVRHGEEIWSLSRDRHKIACELRTQPGAGIDVMIRVDGELSFSRLYADEQSARFAASGLKQDHLRAGWTEQASD